MRLILQVWKTNEPTSQVNKQGNKQTALTAEFNSDEVLEPQVLQEDSGGGAGLEVEGDVNTERGLQGGEVQVGRLLVERRRVPQRSFGGKRRNRFELIECMIVL